MTSAVDTHSSSSSSSSAGAAGAATEARCSRAWGEGLRPWTLLAGCFASADRESTTLCVRVAPFIFLFIKNSSDSKRCFFLYMYVCMNVGILYF
ncbi:hypothetical protein STCU_11514 [Strigomonas culicis]|uniref:Uncharacterized protein n=1 Tax=Strigomonas culicis TaxID=28005 RepID=S9TGY7_9TRYP|nr:hypothetical protein STCU_11514 [Strigomonas culicis]|eukprot:EPY16159.1 hypothetical protein STCU_11514 [Strigomonas culicis]